MPGPSSLAPGSMAQYSSPVSGARWSLEAGQAGGGGRAHLTGQGPICIIFLLSPNFQLLPSNFCYLPSACR